MSAIEVDIKFQGGKEAAEALRKLPQALHKGVLRSALRKVAKPIQGAMESKLASVIQKPMEGPPRIGIWSAKPQQAGSPAALYIGLMRDAFYHSFREFGTKHQRARPWFRPAVDQEGPKAVPPFGLEVWKALVRVAKRLAKGRA